MGLVVFSNRYTPALLRGLCAECPHGSTCRGGCSDLAYAVTDSPYDNLTCLYRLEAPQS